MILHVTVLLAGFGLSLGTYWNVPRNVLARNSDPTSPSGNAQGPGPRCRIKQKALANSFQKSVRGIAGTFDAGELTTGEGVATTR